MRKPTTPEQPDKNNIFREKMRNFLKEKNRDGALWFCMQTVEKGPTSAQIVIDYFYDWVCVRKISASWVFDFFLKILPKLNFENVRCRSLITHFYRNKKYKAKMTPILLKKKRNSNKKFSSILDLDRTDLDPTEVLVETRKRLERKGLSRREIFKILFLIKIKATGKI